MAFLVDSLESSSIKILIDWLIDCIGDSHGTTGGVLIVNIDHMYDLKDYLKGIFHKRLPHTVALSRLHLKNRLEVKMIKLQIALL